MALYKRGNTWWISLSHQGTRVQKSTGTTNKVAAQRFYDQLKADVWKVDKLKERPKREWNDAVIRWCKESQHKKSLKSDICNFRWLDEHLNGVLLQDITRDVVERIAQIKENGCVSPATVNRMLALVRSVLRKAEREWDWIERSPSIRMRREDNKRIRWLTYEEAERLKKQLPEHLANAMEFALQTGLRRANITSLEWSQIDFDRCHAFIPAHKSKSGKAIAVPLNSKAIDVLKNQMGKHPQFVFSYGGRPIIQLSTKAWKKALSRAGIKNFKWHDLRHTWASWHVQHGTSLQELQQLGGWAGFEMVLRYAHLCSKHLRNAAERISATNLLHQGMQHV